MEMTLKRWIVGFAALAVGIALAELPPEPPTFRRSRPLITNPELTGAQRRESRLRSQWLGAREWVRYARYRDEALAAAGPFAPDAQPFVHAPDEMSQRLRDYIVAEVRDDWNRLARRRSDIRVVVAVRMVDPNSTEPSGNNWVRARIALPGDTDGVTCLVTYFFGLGAQRRVDAGVDPALVFARSVTPTGIAGCGYVAAFGAPGEAIGDWLVNGTGFSFSAESPWTRAAPVASSDASHTRYLFSYNLEEAASMRCAAHGGDACTEVVVGRPSARFATRSRPSNPWYNDRWGVWLPNQRSMLSGLVDRVGPDTFQRVWRSNLPIDQAFAAAGVDLNGEVRGWLLGAGLSRFANRGFAGWDVLGTLLIAAAGLGGGIAINRKRQV